MPSISASDVAIGMMPGLVDLGQTLSNAWVEKRRVEEQRRQFNAQQTEGARRFDEGQELDRRKTALTFGVGARPGGGRWRGGAGGGGSLRDPFKVESWEVPSSKPDETFPMKLAPRTEAEMQAGIRSVRASKMSDAAFRAGRADLGAKLNDLATRLTADTSGKLSGELAAYETELNQMLMGQGGQPATVSRNAVSGGAGVDETYQFLKEGPPFLQRPMKQPALPPPPTAQPAPAPAPGMPAWQAMVSRLPPATSLGNALGSFLSRPLPQPQPGPDAEAVASINARQNEIPLTTLPEGRGVGRGGKPAAPALAPEAARSLVSAVLTKAKHPMEIPPGVAGSLRPDWDAATQAKWQAAFDYQLAKSRQPTMGAPGDTGATDQVERLLRLLAPDAGVAEAEVQYNMGL